jgi:hypothetical protein
VYIGPSPYFSGCFYGWLNTGNVITSTDHRWDCTQRGGGYGVNYSDCLPFAAGAIADITVVLDGGWTAPRGQDATVDNFTINKKVMQALDCF